MQAGASVLIIDRVEEARELAGELERIGCRAQVGSDEHQAVPILGSPERLDLVVLELWLNSRPNFALLSLARALQPHATIVVATARGAIATAVSAMRLGASNYLCKPISGRQLMRELKVREPDTEPAARYPSLDRIIWEHIHYVLDGAGTLAEASRRLRVDRRSLRRMLAKNPPPV